MRVLLDTHAFLWFALNDSRLSSVARQAIIEPGNEVLLSPASLWEIAIKISLGKYALSEPFAEFMKRQIIENQLTWLPITVDHITVVTSLPFHHRDPFDRLLIAQTMVEGIEIISNDVAFDSYSITRLW